MGDITVTQLEPTAFYCYLVLRFAEFRTYEDVVPSPTVNLSNLVNKISKAETDLLLHFQELQNPFHTSFHEFGNLFAPQALIYHCLMLMSCCGDQTKGTTISYHKMTLEQF